MAAPVEALLQFGNLPANVVSAIVAETAELMRRGDDRRRAVVDRESGHRQRFVPVLGAVIDARQQVAVNIDKRESSWRERGEAARSGERMAPPFARDRMFRLIDEREEREVEKRPEYSGPEYVKRVQL